VAATDATSIERGALAKRHYGNYFPSVNANYNITENIIARASYSQTVGRPDIGNIAPGITLPDTSLQQTDTNSNTWIRVNNPGLKPWTSRNFSLSLEYYSKNLGDITLRGFRRFIRNGFNTQTLSRQAAKEYLDFYGVNPDDYPDSFVSVRTNNDNLIVTSGVELSSRYSLDNVLPNWTRGFQVKFSATRNTETGSDSDFSSQGLRLSPYSAGFGVSFERGRGFVSVTGKWNAKRRLNLISPSASVDPGTYQYQDANLRVDLNASLRITRRISVFLNGRDINGYDLVMLQYSPATPEIAKKQNHTSYQTVWTAGLRGKF